MPVHRPSCLSNRTSPVDGNFTERKEILSSVANQKGGELGGQLRWLVLGDEGNRVLIVLEFRICYELKGEMGSLVFRN